MATAYARYKIKECFTAHGLVLVRNSQRVKERADSTGAELVQQQKYKDSANYDN
jgi:hypothetical protein